MEIVLLWCFVLAWMAKRGAEDLVHAVKGTPNPRYELKKAKAASAGQPVKGAPRYGGREWFADLYSDALAAHTERRRAAAKAKAAPLDDLVEAVREPVRHPHDPNSTRNCPVCKGEVVLDGRPCPRCLAEQERRNAEWEAQQPDSRGRCPDCGAPNPFGTPCQAHNPDPRPDARIIQFPTVKLIEKEITMANSEVTGLSTAIAFANHASNAHTEFATTGTEGYVGALERAGNSGDVIATAREAMEASGVAADKWAAHREELEKQLTGKEFYQSNPDAGDKQFQLAE